MKALRNSFLAIVALTAIAAAAAAKMVGSGNAATEPRAVSGFTGLALSIPARVDIVQGATEGVTLTADDNLLPEIETVAENGVLRIRFRNRIDARIKTPIRIALNAKMLDSISIAGSGDVHAAALRAERLKVSIAGSGDVRLAALDARELSATISGSGDFEAAGRSDSIELRISGSGGVKAGKLATQRASVTIAGSGDVLLWTRESLNVKVAGSGDVRYYGDPTVQRSVAGSGAVKRLGAAPT